MAVVVLAAAPVQAQALSEASTAPSLLSLASVAGTLVVLRMEH